MNFLFNTPDAAIDGRFRHSQFHCNFDSGIVLHTEVKYFSLVRSKIADIAEPLTFRLRKFVPDVHGHFRFRLRLTVLTLAPFEPDLRRCTTTLAIVNTSGVIALDVVGVT